MRNLLVTGGAGFIGSNFIHYLFEQNPPPDRVINLDMLTYAGNPQNLKEIEALHNGKRYFFEKIDIRDRTALDALFARHEVDFIVHFAAESHVDRSIVSPDDFIQTNIVGTYNLLEAARHSWKNRQHVRFHHVSTDEVYGSLGKDGYFFESTAYDPRSPYSASKAASDHLVRAYHHTYGLPITLSNCSNNYGPYQFPEKLIPLMILNLQDEKPLPVYGDGKNVRDWLHVRDHCAALALILEKGQSGRTYNIGGENEWENLRLVHTLCELMAQRMGKTTDYYKQFITFVKDRPGHDRRYAINCDRIKQELGWSPAIDFRSGLAQTIAWYLDHPEWIASVRSGDYRKWIQTNYEHRT